MKKSILLLTLLNILNGCSEAKSYEVYHDRVSSEKNYITRNLDRYNNLFKCINTKSIDAKKSTHFYILNTPTDNTYSISKNSDTLSLSEESSSNNRTKWWTLLTKEEAMPICIEELRGIKSSLRACDLLADTNFTPLDEKIIYQNGREEGSKLITSRSDRMFTRVKALNKKDLNLDSEGTIKLYSVRREDDPVPHVQFLVEENEYKVYLYEQNKNTITPLECW